MSLSDIPYIPLITTHVFLSPLSGMLLLLAAFIMLFRDTRSRINQLFFGFLSGYGFYQIFDGLLYLELFINKNDYLANLYRDLSITFYLLGLIFGALSVLSIYYGEDYLNDLKSQLLWLMLTVVIIFGGIIFDSANISNQTQQRTVLGWIIILGSFIGFTTIIVGYLVKLVQDSVNPEVKHKMTELLIGTSSMILILFVFDIAFILIKVNLIYKILSIDLIHTIVHIIVLLSVGLIVKSFWTPVKA